MGRHNLQCTFTTREVLHMSDDRGLVGGAFTNIGTILVLFILLVIIALSCGWFGY